MVDTALLFVGAAALTSAVGVAAAVARYAADRSLHYWALAAALTFGGLALELGVANGFLRETGPVSAVLGVGVVAVVPPAVVAAWR